MVFKDGQVIMSIDLVIRVAMKYNNELDIYDNTSD